MGKGSSFAKGLIYPSTAALLVGLALASTPEAEATQPGEAVRPQMIRTVSESGGDVVNAVEMIRYPTVASMTPPARTAAPRAAAQPATRKKASRRVLPEQDPAVVHCVTQAAASFGVEPTPMYLILDVERGTLGKVSMNKNGTYDMGPAQINSAWLPKLSRYGISEYAVTSDLCTNVRVAMWIYATELKRHNGDIIKAIKHYHSPTTVHQQRYIGLIAKRSSERTTILGQTATALVSNQ